MKSFTLSIICTILAIAALAQAPQGISHQAVVRNAAGNLVINSIIGVRITVLRDSIDGAPVYSETQYPVSNSSGLITFVVGHGMPDENTLFNNINWLLGSHFLKLEIDPDGGVNYRISGTSQLHGVPYAFVADEVVFINPEGSEHGNVLIYNSATGMYEPDSAGAVVFSKPLDIMPRTAMRGQQLSVSFSGGTQIAFSEDTNSCPGVYADVVLHFSQGASTLNIHPRGSYFLSPGRFDAIFDIPATAPAGLYDIIFGHSSPCEFTAFESFRIRGKILLSTSAVTNITSNSAQSGGNITDDGGAPITARGVCWSTAPNPTIASNKTNNGSGTGSFTSNLTGLNPNTTYYVRAYSISSEEVAYGNQFSFATTASVFVCGGIFTDPRDGNQYTTKLYGNRCWMTKNLAYLPSVNPPNTASRHVPNYYVNGYNGSNVAAAKATANYQNYGALYNWQAARIVCPTGWHLPTRQDWDDLISFIGEQYTAGYDMKSTRTSPTSHPRWNSPNSASNSSGFSALPGGARTPGSVFQSPGSVGIWWSYTVANLYDSYYNGMANYHISVVQGWDDKVYGLSVRCRK